MALIRHPHPETYSDLEGKIEALTQERSLFTKCDVVGAIGHARGSLLDLAEAMEAILLHSAEDSNINGNTKDIEIYADHLRAQKPVLLGDSVDSITIISRAVLPGAQRSCVDMKLSGAQQQLSIQLFCAPPQRPVTFRATFSDGSTSEATVDSKNMEPGHRCWGLGFDRGKQGSADSLGEIDALNEMFRKSTRSIAEKIQDDGHLADMGWDSYNDNIRRLLNYQLLLASTVQDEDKNLATQIAEFVAHICQGIPKAFDLYSQASVMAMSQTVGQESLMNALVPKLDLSTAQQVLNSRLDAAEAFDSAYRDLQGQKANSDNVRLLATVALERSVDSDSVYSFITKTTQGRLNNAQTAFSKAEREFQALQLLLKGHQDEFKKGIEDWKTAKTWEAVGEVFAAVAAVAGSIALACVAPPAGAAGIGAGAAALGAAASGAEKTVSLFQKFAKVVRAIEKIYNKIMPYLEKMKEVVDAIKNVIAIVEKQGSMEDFGNEEIGKLKLPDVAGDDAINITADWDIFQVEMNNLYDGIKGENIGGAEGFFTLITKMVIRGKAMFAAQTALASASDAYLIVMQQQIAQKQHTDRLRKAISNIQGNPRTLAVVKLAIAERLLALRANIDLDFRQYLAAYAWNALDARRPLALDPLKDIGSFRSDAATLQALSAQVYAQARSQTRLFRLSCKRGDLLAKVASSEHASPHAADVVSVLKQNREASFTLNYESPLFRRYGRFRLSKARMFLDNAKAEDEQDPVSLRITLGTAMKDLGVDKVKDAAAPLPGIDASRVLHFVTTESTFGFEYAGKDNEVLLEGAFCGYFESSSLLMSPFRPWTVSVESDANLDAVTDITLELECQVTYV